MKGFCTRFKVIDDRDAINKMEMMFLLGVLIAFFGNSAVAIDLSGCRPKQPVVITGLMQLAGDIKSPGYSEGQVYPDDLFCEYRIHAPYGFRIKLTFQDVDIEVADMCMRDAIELVEVVNNQARGLGVFCGNQTYPPVVSSTNVIIIMFRSDFMVGRRGFHIRYQISGMPSVCNYLGTIPCRNRNCYYPMDRCNGVDNCGDGSDEQSCGFPQRPAECGVRKIAGQYYGGDRVIGGKEAVPGSWPWQADLQLNFIHPNGHNCGGTLINSEWVLSAAHCFTQFRQPEMWRIHLGKHNKFQRDKSEQIRYGQRVILYPGTTGNELHQLPQIDMQNDLALIKLNAPVKITDQVRPACLPSQGHELPVGTKCMASGWGMTKGTGTFTALKEVDMSIQTAEACNGQMGPIQEDTMICVKNAAGYQDVCHGDSGGPLVCELNGKWNVMGATSFGTQGNHLGGLCALNGSATVYSKVSHKSDWIQQQINKYS